MPCARCTKDIICKCRALYILRNKTVLRGGRFFQTSRRLLPTVWPRSQGNDLCRRPARSGQAKRTKRNQRKRFARSTTTAVHYCRHNRKDRVVGVVGWCRSGSLNCVTLHTISRGKGYPLPASSRSAAVQQYGLLLPSVFTRSLLQRTCRKQIRTATLRTLNRVSLGATGPSPPLAFTVRVLWVVLGDVCGLPPAARGDPPRGTSTARGLSLPTYCHDNIWTGARWVLRRPSNSGYHE